MVGIRALVHTVQQLTASCSIAGSSVEVEPSQAANAATIAGVAVRLGLPDHAVTIALATALQESKLQNLDHGDLDSVGLFQQRPSQGWGARAQLLDPAYAASAFYSHLEAVPGWETLPVAEAAQDVQHSADGSAYEQWADEARGLAVALTGEHPAAVSCTLPSVPSGTDTAITDAAVHVFGPSALAAGTAKHDWAVAAWLVGNAQQYGITRVAARGQVWSASSGHWSPDARATGAPTWVVAAPRPSS